MGIESINNQEKRRGVTLEDLFSDEPIHGLQYERFTEQQKKDVESLLSQGGYDIHLPIYGETVLDIIDYVQERPGSEKRNELGARILEAFSEAFVQYGEEPLRKAA